MRKSVLLSCISLVFITRHAQSLTNIDFETLETESAKDWEVFGNGSHAVTFDQTISLSADFVKFTKGNADYPEEFSFTETIQVGNHGSKSYRGKHVVVLVNELSQSHAEFTAMVFKAGDKTTIAGSTNAGAHGNVSYFSLQGGLHTAISGIGVYYPDGTETQRVGIVPDVVVLPTIQGIKDGINEPLEKAIKIINKV